MPDSLAFDDVQRRLSRIKTAVADQKALVAIKASELQIAKSELKVLLNLHAMAEKVLSLSALTPTLAVNTTS